MAAFTAKDPADKKAFAAFWDRIRSDPTVPVRTILYRGQVAGSVLSYRNGARREVSYWIGKRFWGRGIATEGLARAVRELRGRALYARVATDNLASIRVLEKCGFSVCGQERGFANARGAEIDEFLFKRDNPRKR
jgi:RimJ/RimL family protein N-acetyltransferase